MRWRRGVLAGLLAVAAATGLALLPQRAVVAVAGEGGPVAARPLPADGRFDLSYLHSYYRVEAVESFRASPGGGFDLVGVASPSEAVLDYYGLPGERRRDGGWLRLDPRPPRHFSALPLAATPLGRRTLVVGAERVALTGARPAHVTIRVQRRPWLLAVLAAHA
jgi:hypothetical protein